MFQNKVIVITGGAGGKSSGYCQYGAVSGI